MCSSGSAAHKADEDEVFAQATWLSKPCDSSLLVSVVADALESAPEDFHGGTDGKRRRRGCSPRGEFEVAKAVALAL
jgi:hypothetical protein